MFGDHKLSAGPAYGERYRELGDLLDACSERGTRDCWLGEDDVHYKLRVFHDTCYLLSLGEHELAVPCEEALPDLDFGEVTSICSSAFTCVSVDGFAALVAKTVPRHCAMRDFARKCDALADGRDKKLCSKLVLVVLASLMGNYRHCKRWLSAKKRRTLLRIFHRDPAGQFCRDITNKHHDAQHVFAFTSIREYLSVAMERLPALCKFAHDRYNWQEIAAGSRATLDSCRHSHNSVHKTAITTATVLYNSVVALTQLRPSSCQVAILRPKSTFQADVSKVIGVRFPGIFSRKYFTSPEEAKHWTLLLSDVRRGVCLELGFLAEILTEGGAGSLQAAARAWLAKKPFAHHLDSIGEDDAVMVRNFFVAQSFLESFSVVELPESVVRRQVLAAVERFSDLLSPFRSYHRSVAVEWASKFRVCAVCNNVRNYLADGEKPSSRKKKRKRQGDGAIGFRDCWHNFENGRVGCKGTNSANDRTRACKQSFLHTTQLLRINEEDGSAKGFAVKFNGEEYMVSPCCAVVCTRHTIRFDRNGTWNCPACRRANAMQEVHSCDFCKKEFMRSSALTRATLANNTGEWCCYTFCKTHAKGWFTGDQNAYKFSAKQVMESLQAPLCK